MMKPDSPFERIAASSEEVISTLRSIPLRHKIGVTGLFGGLLLPSVLDVTATLTLTGIIYIMIFAMSWDFVSGYTGQLSLGHTFFFAIGGYGTTVLNIHYGIHPLLGIGIATVLAAIGGLLLGLPALRLRGPYLALITLTAPLILFQIFIFYGGIFKGQTGFATSPDLLVGMSSGALITLNSYGGMVLANFYLAFALFALVYLVCFVVTRLMIGDVFTAIRENEDIVGAAGINVVKFKLFAFVVSATIGGLAGAIYVHSPVGHPSPSTLLELSLAIELVFMVIMGGLGTITGAAVGALLFETIREAMKVISSEPHSVTIPVLGMTPDELMPVPLFLVLVVVVYYMPNGFVPWSVMTGRRVLREYTRSKP